MDALHFNVVARSIIRVATVPMLSANLLTPVDREIQGKFRPLSGDKETSSIGEMGATSDFDIAAVKEPM